MDSVIASLPQAQQELLARVAQLEDHQMCNLTQQEVQQVLELKQLVRELQSKCNTGVTTDSEGCIDQSNECNENAASGYCTLI